MSEQLAGLFQGSEVGTSQQTFMVGTLTGWDGTTRASTVNCQGTIYQNLQIIAEGSGYVAGQTVLLARTATKPIIIGKLLNGPS